MKIYYFASIVIVGAVLLFPSTVSGRAFCRNISKKNFDLCKNIPYNHTYYPNILDNRNINEAIKELSVFTPMVRVACSNYLEPFLCSVYVPSCREEEYGIIYPCRSLCEKAKNGCSELMNRFGFQWPRYLECNLFPVKSNKTRCLDSSEFMN